MNERTLLGLLSAGRIAVGAAFMAAPARGAASWIGTEAQRPGAGVLARAFGARDLALGAATLAALSGRAPLRPLLLGGIVADTTDAAATLAAGDGIPVSARRAVTAVAVGAALGGAWLATRLD